jgi:hypothetical protein
MLRDMLIDTKCPECKNKLVLSMTDPKQDHYYCEPTKERSYSFQHSYYVNKKAILKRRIK